MYILDNDLDDQPDNNLFSDEKQLSSHDEDDDTKKELLKKQKVISDDKKPISVMKKLDMLYREEAQKIVEESARKAYVTVAGRETIQPKLLNF